MIILGEKGAPGDDAAYCPCPPRTTPTFDSVDRYSPMHHGGSNNPQPGSLAAGASGEHIGSSEEHGEGSGWTPTNHGNGGSTVDGSGGYSGTGYDEHPSKIPAAVPHVAPSHSTGPGASAAGAGYL